MNICHPKTGTWSADRVRQFICELVSGQMGDRVAFYLEYPASEAERLQLAAELLQLLQAAAQEASHDS